MVTSSVWAGGCPATMLARLVPSPDPAQHSATCPARGAAPAFTSWAAAESSASPLVIQQPSDLSTRLLLLKEPQCQPTPPARLGAGPRQLLWWQGRKLPGRCGRSSIATRAAMSPAMEARAAVGRAEDASELPHSDGSQQSRAALSPGHGCSTTSPMAMLTPKAPLIHTLIHLSEN